MLKRLYRKISFEMEVRMGDLSQLPHNFHEKIMAKQKPMMNRITQSNLSI